jgi:hypothetical protein
MAPAGLEYINALRGLGLLQGETGDRQIPGEVREVLGALHHVLAGGRVNIDIPDPGTASIVERLDITLDRALRESSDVERQYPMEVCF